MMWLRGEGDAYDAPSLNDWPLDNKQEPRTVLEIAADEDTFLTPPARQGASGNAYSPYQHDSNPFGSGSAPDTDYATPGDDALAEEKADRAEERPGMHGI